MGSMIHLALGRLEVDWGKNNFFTEHGQLFQPEDRKPVPYYYVGDDWPDGDPNVELKDGFGRRLREIRDRLDLLGFTVQNARLQYEELHRLHEIQDEPLPFDSLAEALAKVDVNGVSANYGEDHAPGKFVRREIIERLSLNTAVDTNGLRSDSWEIELLLENFGPYSALRLLAENPANLDLEVCWSFHDVLENGWADESSFVAGAADVDRFLLVTEGSSDAKIIAHALKLRRPHIADFFRFVDMEEGYLFSGTGNVYRFAQGLVSIGIQNKTLIVFDNDAEGCSKLRSTQALNLPDNMRAVRLPDLSTFSQFPTIGPTGPFPADINGQAGAIECYLDLRFGTDKEARVRWTSYNRDGDAYQGELEQKTEFMKRFLALRIANPKYDFSKLDAVLDAIVEQCVAIAEAGQGPKSEVAPISIR